VTAGPEGFSWTERAALRLGAGEGAGGAAEGRASDALAVEEPLEVRVDGAVVAVTMRTPGGPDDDRRLALGFLLAEGVIRSIADVAGVERPAEPGAATAPSLGYCNAIDVRLAPGAPGAAAGGEALERARRGTLTSAACGVCGRGTIEDLLARLGRLPPGPSLPRATLLSAPERLRAAQPTFGRTGAVHAAAALALDAQVLSSAEDVGRHNAVDKVVGALLERGAAPPAPEPESVAATPPSLADLPGKAPPVPATARCVLLVVSGRVSFEMVQKTAAAGIPALAGVGGATSLAVDLAQRCGMFLAAFVREGRASVYAGEERLEG
jgi:FdhD protein